MLAFSRGDARCSSPRSVRRLPFVPPASGKANAPLRRQHCHATVQRGATSSVIALPVACEHPDFRQPLSVSFDPVRSSRTALHGGYNNIVMDEGNARQTSGPMWPKSSTTSHKPAKSNHPFGGLWAHNGGWPSRSG
jgi:hypothetical protein